MSEKHTIRITEDSPWVTVDLDKCECGHNRLSHGTAALSDGMEIRCYGAHSCDCAQFVPAAPGRDK